MDPLLTTDEVAELLRLDVVTVRRLVARSELAAYKVAGEFRFQKKDVEEYLARQRLPSQGEAQTGRFDEHTRMVLQFAQEEAVRCQDSGIGPEHILVALLRVEDGGAAQILSDFGLTLSQAREAAKRRQRTTHGAPSGHGVPLLPETKKVIESALSEARSLSQASIHTEHLLLGLIDDRSSQAVLADLGVDPREARVAAMNRLQSRD